MSESGKFAKTIGDEIAAYIGNLMGGILERKSDLQRQLKDVERQIETVRQQIRAQLAELSPPDFKRRPRGRVVRKMSAETRAKMAEAARRRWAATKRAGKNALG